MKHILISEIAVSQPQNAYALALILLFIFNMTSKTIFKVHNTQYAIYCDSLCGPRFGSGALSLVDEPMNRENAGVCCVGHDYCGYKVEEDSEGNSPVTSAGGNKEKNRKWLTCVEVEVYKLIF